MEKFKRLDYACFEDKDVQDTLTRMSSDPQYKVFQLFLTITGVIECIIGVISATLIYSQAGWWFVTGFAILTHNELLKANGEYARLYKVQEKWYRS